MLSFKQMLNLDKRGNEPKYVQIVFNRWLEIYKKGIIVYMVLLAISKKFNTSETIKNFLLQNELEIKQISLYRTLRRLESMSLIEYKTKGIKGTQTYRKLFFITSEGRAFLQKMNSLIKKIAAT